jgi:hypothetical protein
VPAEARERIERLLAAARRIADPSDPLGREARALLPASSRLSPSGVELALTRCLETRPRSDELACLLASVAAAPRAHVSLSANVFTAAHRAIAVALAASATVFVKPSRREPDFARLLAAAAPGLFRLVESLAPAPGDHVFAYGADSTLAALHRALPAGTRLHANGSGFGIAAVQANDASSPRTAQEWSKLADGLALDVALFDQRGCLSPRLVLFEGSALAAADFARTLARALERREAETPRGELSDAERGELARQRQVLTYAGTVETAGSGFVALLDGGAGAPPALGGRSLVVAITSDVASRVGELSPEVTTYAAAGSSAFTAAVARALPVSRPAAFGAMQTPAFDGPVDLRAASIEITRQFA